MNNIKEMSLEKMMAEKISSSLDDQIAQAINGQTLAKGYPTSPAVLDMQSIEGYLKQVKLDKRKDSLKEVNEYLKEKGYPDFDKILDYWLEEHPEYKL